MGKAEELRDLGMSRAANAQERAAPGWTDRAYAALLRIARRKTTVHVDDLLRKFAEEPDHPNAWGSVWRRAIRNGIIVHSGGVMPCMVDPGKHKHQSPVYSSLIYGEA